MKIHKIQKRIAFFPTLILLLLLSGTVFAEETSSVSDVDAVNIIANSTITLTDETKANQKNMNILRDGKNGTKINFADGAQINIENPQKTAGLYLIWDIPPEKLTIDLPNDLANGNIISGQEQYLHQYVEILTPQNNITLKIKGKAVLCEIVQLTVGKLPDTVQNWSAPLAKADMLFLPTHADDEHLYFGGTMPTYSAKGLKLQVAYMVNHNGEPYRPHELLNGLWTVGIRNYPIIPKFKDMYSESLEHAKTIYNENEILDYQISLIRRFKPSVIIGHDINGEYGHGAHRLNAATLQKAVIAAADETKSPESATEYGIWDTPKTYLHLWDKQPIIMNWDIPIAEFNGATAFEMAVKGYACHFSQQSYFTVKQTGPYDCRKFGLYRSTVGEDVKKDDFFENISFEPVTEPVISQTQSEPLSSQAEISSTVSSVVSSTVSSKIEQVKSPQDDNSDNKINWIIVAAALLMAVILLAFVFIKKFKK